MSDSKIVRYHRLDSGDYRVDSDDGVFSAVMTESELESAKAKMPDREWLLGQPIESWSMAGADHDIKWQVREYIGAEVLTTPPDLTFEKAQRHTNWPEGFKPEPIREESGIREGTVILLPTIGGYAVAQVHVERGPEDDYTYYAQTPGGMMGLLEWDADDRHAWTCGGTANLKAIQKMELYR